MDDWDNESVLTGCGVTGDVGAEELADMMAENRFGGLARGRRGSRVMSSECDDEEECSEIPEGLVVNEEKVAHMRRAVELRAARMLELREYGKSWQELVRARAYNFLQRGHFTAGDTAEISLKQEKVFRVTKTYTLDEFENAQGLYEAIKKGPVVANVVAKTGIGKSTKFAASMAKHTGKRVLQLTPDAILKEEHGSMLAKSVRVSRLWTEKQQALVTMMSVGEFCGRFMISGWEDVFAMFDIILMDEAHIPLRWFYAAKAAMCTLGDGTVSLLLVTATNMAVSDAQSVLTRPVFRPRRMEDLVADPLWIDSDIAVDRGMYIVESDERLAEIARLVDAQGCRVFTLTSGSSAAAVEQVRRAFVGDSPTIRILVAHECFGTGYSLNVSRVVTTGLRLVLHMTEETAEYRAVPLTKVEIKQHVGRADRGDVQSVGPGVVLLNEGDAAPNVGLLESEKFGTAIVLVAMGIAPGPVLAPCLANVFPAGLSRRVAVSLLVRRGLPPEITVRYLTAGGRMPAAFSKALDKFSLEYTGASVASKDIYPKDYDKWYDEKPFEMLGYEEGPVVKVPFKAQGELKAILHAVSCIWSQAYVPENIPLRREDPELSGPEQVEKHRKRTQVKGYKPPRVLDLMDTVQEEGRVVRESFQVDVSAAQQPGFRRRGVSVFNATFVNDLNMALNTIEVEETRDDRGRVVVTLRGDTMDGSPVELQGSGGEILFTIPKAMWVQMQDGVELEERFAKSLLALIKANCKGFAYSNAFANFGNAWLSVLATCSNPVVLEYIKRKVLYEGVLAFFGCLWERYVGGMHLSVQTSHVMMSFWERLVKSWGSRVIRPVQDTGQSNIAQSQAFKTRLYDIRAGFSHLMVAMERHGIFSPFAVSELQRVLPVSQSVGYGVHDVVRRGHARSRSKDEISSGDRWAREQVEMADRLRTRQNMRMQSSDDFGFGGL